MGGDILISSDHHHDDFKSFSRPGDNAVPSRLQEGLDAENFLYEYMVRNKIYTHIRLGDLFHRKNSLDFVVFNEINRILSRNQGYVQEIALVGNHDEAKGGVRHALESFQPSMHVVSEPEVLAHEGFTFYILPHLGSKSSIVDEAKKLTHRINGDTINVFLGHFGVHGSKTGSEFLLPDYVNASDIHSEKYDLGFLGHIHEPQHITDNTRYVGSLIQRSFSDIGAQRRAYHLTSEGAVKEVAIPGPRFYHAKVNNVDDLVRDIDGNGYYRVTVTNKDITEQQVAAAFLHAKGWILHYEIASSDWKPRLSSHSLGWRDLVFDFIEAHKDEWGEEAYRRAKKISEVTLGKSGL